MISLYNRATPTQIRILRAVEGAVRNAAHGHPRYDIPESFARSVAKRAAGTLTAQWPDVLAARFDESSGTGGSYSGEGRPRGVRGYQRLGRGPSYVSRRSPLPGLWKAISAKIRPLKDAGKLEKVAALVEVLKMIAELQRVLSHREPASACDDVGKPK